MSDNRVKTSMDESKHRKRKNSLSRLAQKRNQRDGGVNIASRRRSDVKWKDFRDG